MVEDPYVELLELAGKHFSCELEPDPNNTCLLSVDGEVEVQLEMDPTQDFFVMGTKIGELPPGKFREEVLKEALIANNRPYPRNGNLAYSRKLNCLVMYEMFEIKHFPLEVIISVLTLFIENAKKWKRALSAGQTTPYTQADQDASKGNGKMFGLK